RKQLPESDVVAPDISGHQPLFCRCCRLRHARRHEPPRRTYVRAARSASFEAIESAGTQEPTHTPPRTDLATQPPPILADRSFSRTSSSASAKMLQEIDPEARMSASKNPTTSGARRVTDSHESRTSKSLPRPSCFERVFRGEVIQPLRAWLWAIDF